MRSLGNIIWHVLFLGFVSALFTFLLGGILVMSVVAAPIGLGLIELSKLLVSPFSKAMINKKDLHIEQNKQWEAYGWIVRILYFPIGLMLAMITIVQIIVLFITVVGIPVAAVLSKSLSTFFNPVNKKCVPVAVVAEIERRKAQEYVDKHIKQ